MPAKILDGPTAWKYLNGVINVYKPAGIKVKDVRSSIIGNLCKDLNSLEVRRPIQRIAIEPGGNNKYLVRQEESLADDVLAVGPRYQLKDFKFGVVAGLGQHTSGVLGINDGLKTTTKIQSNRSLRVYHVTGCFGKSTENFFEDSRITATASFSSVKRDRLESYIEYLRTTHQRKIYDMYGLDLKSQSTYELACNGLVPPTETTLPVMIYGMRLIYFIPPEFTLEIHVMNESEEYLATLINYIAIKQRSVGFCSKIRCIRHGHFTIDDSLLRRHWTLDGVLQSMEESRKILQDHPEVLRKSSPVFNTD